MIVSPPDTALCAVHVACPRFLWAWNSREKVLLSGAVGVRNLHLSGGCQGTHFLYKYLVMWPWLSGMLLFPWAVKCCKLTLSCLAF